MNDRKVPNPAEFYSHGSMGITYLDRWLYRGKGRPRKTDYSTISLLQKKINATYKAMLEARSLGEVEGYSITELCPRCHKRVRTVTKTKLELESELLHGELHISPLCSACKEAVK